MEVTTSLSKSAFYLFFDHMHVYSSFYHSFVHDACSKYEGQSEDITVRRDNSAFYLFFDHMHVYSSFHHSYVHDACSKYEGQSEYITVRREKSAFYLFFDHMHACSSFYHSYVHDACSKYEGQSEDITVRRTKSLDYSVEDSGCNKLQDAGPFSSLGSEGSGIQKIIPSDFKVSVVKAFVFYFFVFPVPIGT